MVLSILARLAAFSLKKPKTVAIAVAVFAVLAFGVHYKLLVGERDKLRVAEEGYKVAVAAFIDREAALQEDLRLEREAAQVAVTERDNAREAVKLFRNSRVDAESIEWAAQSVPVGEMERLCAALPEMTGCQNTAPNN